MKVLIRALKARMVMFEEVVVPLSWRDVVNRDHCTADIEDLK